MAHTFRIHFASPASPIFRHLSRVITAAFGSVALVAGVSACSAPVATGSTSVVAPSPLSVSRQCDQEAATAVKIGSLSSGFPLSLMPYSAAYASDLWLHIADQCPTRFGSSSLQAARADVSARLYASVTGQASPHDDISAAQQGQHNLSNPSTAPTTGNGSADNQQSITSSLSPSDAAAFSLSFDRLAFSEEFLAARSASLRTRYLPVSQSHRQIAALLQHRSAPGSQCSQLATGSSANSSADSSSNSRLTCKTDSRQRLYSAARLVSASNTKNSVNAVNDTMTGIPAPLNAVLLMEAGLESAQSAGLSSSDSAAQRHTAAAWAAALMSSAFYAGYPFFTPAAR
jgi:hypothetical protein